MSTIYVSIRSDARGVGVAVLKSGAWASIDDNTIRIGLCDAVVVGSAAFASNSPTAAARIKAIRKARRWAIATAASAGGCCEPEVVFVVCGEDLSVAAMVSAKTASRIGTSAVFGVSPKHVQTTGDLAADAVDVCRHGIVERDAYWAKRRAR